MFIFALPPVGAEELQIFTENNPPWSLVSADQRPSGYAVEIVREIQKRVNNSDPIRIYPWTRAYNSILNEKGVVVFTMARTKARDHLFQWVGPIVEDSWILIAKKSSRIRIGSLEEAKKLQGIGAVRGYSNDKYLTDHGFTNVDRASDTIKNIHKLAADRFPVLASFLLSYKTELEQSGQKADDYEVVLTFGRLQMYVAHSKDTDPVTVRSWQHAFEEMKADGTVARLLKKWVPDAAVPGRAVAPLY